jgi:hypothetical protein
MLEKLEDLKKKEQMEGTQRRANLMFCGLCIVEYLYKDQQDALFIFSFILINNLYMYQAGLLFIIRRHYSVYTGLEWDYPTSILLAASRQNRMLYIQNSAS